MRKTIGPAVMVTWITLSIVASVVGFGAMLRALSQSGFPALESWNAASPMNWAGLGFTLLGFVFQLLLLAALAWFAVRLRSPAVVPAYAEWHRRAHSQGKDL